jgi:hypothetical protein
MAVQTVEPSLQSGIVEKLREMAASRSSLGAMVEYVRTEIGPSDVYVVPLLSYFCRAFSLPLRDVLPLREWVELRDDQSIASLLAGIERFAAENSQCA